VKNLAFLLAALGLSVVAAHATNAVSLGYSDNTTVINSGGNDNCAEGTLFVNHDGSFENGYAWHYGGTVPPYYGAFGEGYDLGPSGIVACGAYWISTLHGGGWQPTDLYVWAGGAGSGTPGVVLSMVPGIYFASIPTWPTLAENDVSIYTHVTGEFTVGYWGDWPGLSNDYFIGADLNGLGGHPWTNIAPGIGYPTGWNDPSVVWGPTQSLGIGVWWTDDVWSPVVPKTWGSIKAMFE
jgi:hypothetical protein